MGTYTLFMGLIILVAVLLILIIMVQNPKGGGLASSFGGGGAQSLGGGVQSTTNFLDKSTWFLAIALLVLILLSNISAPKSDSGNSEESILKEKLDDVEIQEPLVEEEAPVEIVPASDSVN